MTTRLAESPRRRIELTTRRPDEARAFEAYQQLVLLVALTMTAFLLWMPT